MLTCYHVINGSKKIYVKVIDTDGTPDVYKATIINGNVETDFALLKIEGYSGYYASIADTSEVSIVGDDIVILGYPFGRKLDDEVMNLSVSFTKGYISSVQKKNGITRVLLDISAKAGNSGSPVISLSNGNVIGILCGSITNHNGDFVEEINYMSPISHFLERMTED